MALPGKKFVAIGLGIGLLLLIIWRLMLTSERSGPLRLLVHSQVSPAALDTLEAIAGADPALTIEPVRRQGADYDPQALLAAGEVDLALVENSRAFSTTIQVVVPLFRSVLHIFHREGLAFASPRELLANHSLYVDPGSYTSGRLLALIRQRQGLAADALTLMPTFVPGKTDVMITFSPLLKPRQRQLLKGYRLLAFDEVERIGQGAGSDAIRLLFPQLHPFVIPAQTYRDLGNQQAIATSSVTMLLVTRPGLSEQTVYQLTEALFNQRSRLSQLVPSVFDVLREDFDINLLNFPLHPGAKRYLDRNAPSALERYAEVINVVVYLVALIGTGLVGFLRWNKQRKKDRIDEFYRQILDLKLRARDCQPGRQAVQIREQLDRCEEQAFSLLIAEQLSADESFRILITLIQDVRHILPEAQGNRGNGTKEP